MNINELIEQAQKLTYFKCSDLDGLKSGFLIYLNYLKEENEKFNLTALKTDEDIILKHFYDSILLVNYIDLSNKKIIDVGSGAGFPGVPLAMIFPTSTFYLCEPSKKKCLFLETLVEMLKLKNVHVINNRVENLSSSKRDFFNIGLSRAVGQLNILIELIIPVIKKNGLFVSYKGLNYDSEVKSAEPALKALKSKINKIETTILPDASKETRAFIFILKEDTTPKKYPRNYSIIAQKPIR